MTISDTAPAPRAPTAAADRSRTWRAMWRTHFYAGIFVLPLLVMLALTGLVILYTDVVDDWQYGDLHRAASTEQRASLDDQRAAVARAHPGWSIDSVITPGEPGSTTTFAISRDDGEVVRNVYVDPSDGEVLGDQDPGAGLVGLANRLHGTLNDESLTVPLPTLPGLLGDEPAFSPIPVGDLVVEIGSVWAIALVATGLVLWWPRQRGAGKALLVPRLRRPGRGRWRDLHATGGIVLAAVALFLITTGMPWSDWWGANWSWVASEVTPNQEDFWSMEAPPSSLPEVGDLDRVGNRVPWAAGGDRIPTSGAGRGSMPGMDHGHDAAPTGGPAAAAELPAAASLDLVVEASRQEGMLPGATITLPMNDLSDPDAPVLGSYVVTNPWPSTLGEQGALFLDQFTAETLGRSTEAEWGAIQRFTELGVQTHMGTQFGVVSRVVMTLGCLLVLWSCTTAVVMWWRRRRTGLGFPRRPVDAGLARSMVVAAVVLALVYPLWGLSVLVVLLLDRYVIRAVPPLRRAFGMRDGSPPAPQDQDAGTLPH